MAITLVPEPGDAMLDGDRDAVSPAGKPLARSATAALKVLLPKVVRVTVALAPGRIATEVREPLRVSVGCGNMVIAIGEVEVMPPPKRSR